MSDIRFAFDNVLPVFLLVLAGWLAGKRKLLTKEWGEASSSLVYNLSLPVLIFQSIYTTDLSKVFSPGLFAFGMIGTTLSVLPLILLARLVSKDRGTRGAFVQGSFRGNFIILALPIIANLFGEEGRARASILVTGVTPLYSILGVLILTAYAPESGSKSLARMARSILTNPIIIGAFAAIPFALTGLRLPQALARLVGYLGDIAVPLALLELGASMSRRSLGAKPLATASAVVYKVVILPLGFILAAAALGFRGQELAIIFVLGGAPSSVSSYIMARSMNCDEELAGEIVLATTLASVLSLIAGLMILKGMGLV